MEDFKPLSEVLQGLFHRIENPPKYNFYEMMENCVTEFDRQKVYRIFYKYNYDQIMELLPSNKRVNCYGIDFPRYFTPIEHNAWCVIKCNKMIFYPQYPVLNYILDFGNPLLKIGIELDGKEFHTPLKDLERDKNLYKEGWKIYRITGSEACRPEITPDRNDRYELGNYLNNTIEGIIESIYTVHFDKRPSEYKDYEYIGLCNQSLDNHSYTTYF